MGCTPLPRCSNCAYFHADPSPSMDGICSHTGQSAVAVFFEEHCHLHDPNHNPSLCVICRDHDACDHAKEA